MSATTATGAVEPRAAATLVLVRDSPRGMEVLLTERPKELRFMGGAVVFPGGAVADADLDPRWEAAAPLDAAAAAALMDDEPGIARAAHVCALRESFEEVGLLLAEGAVERVDRAAATDASAFLDQCLANDIRLLVADLVPAGRWVTPLGAPIRFDARFFITRAPQGWEPDPDPREVAAARWATAAETLTELSSGRVAMAPPTVEMLQLLDEFGSVDQAIAAFHAGRSVGTGDLLSMRLSPLVQVVLAPNPGVMTGPGTNTYIVGTGPTAIIDPAVDDDGYIDLLVELAGDLAAILVTHRHPDHVGGVRALVERTGVPVRAHGTQPAGGADVVEVSDEEELRFGGATLRALYTPGHASDHLCYFLDRAASLFAGDNILGEGTAVIAPPDGDMRAYMTSLERLRVLDLDRIFPGHFRPLDGGRAVIDGYIAHRRQREARILAALDDGPATMDEIVAVAYADTPSALHPVARYSAQAHLEMLQADGRVRLAGDRWEALGVE
jgi:glyoxylase-like metal-dependent hydrolase (beta-lactamase superfamily II)/8-oxo-dGTP pyrophosphatase MutT (NUDIX family)